jgi:hypothetical protein
VPGKGDKLSALEGPWKGYIELVIPSTLVNKGSLAPHYYFGSYFIVLTAGCYHLQLLSYLLLPDLAIIDRYRQLTLLILSKRLPATLHLYQCYTALQFIYQTAPVDRSYEEGVSCQVHLRCCHSSHLASTHVAPFLSEWQEKL